MKLEIIEDRVADDIDDLACVLEHWVRNRDRGRTPNAAGPDAASMIHLPDLVGWAHYEVVAAVRILRAAGRGEGDQAAARRHVERAYGADVLERAQRAIAEEPPLPVLVGEWEVPHGPM